MSDQPETLDAILADYRADIPAMTSRELPHPTPEYLRSYADRIEAAAERERAEWRRQLRNEILINDALATTRPQFNYVDDVIAEAAKERAHEIELAKLRAPGNAAAFREALENVERVARFCAEMPRHTPGYPTDAARADVLCSRIAELGRVARAAIAAPARNCDRPECADVESAWATYCADTNRADCKGFARWLFATAEGGAK